MKPWRSLYGSGFLLSWILLDRFFEMSFHVSPPVAPKVVPRRKVVKKASESKSSPLPAVEPIVVDEEESQQQPSQSPIRQSQPQSQNPSPTTQFLSQTTTTTLLEEEAELYFWDVQTEGFRNDGIVTARFVQQNANSEFTYWLTASNDQGIILAHRIKSDMNQRFSGRMFSLTWNHMGEEGGVQQSSWLLRFSGVEEYKKVVEVFTRCLWETLHQVSWGKIKVCCFSWVWNFFNGEFVG